MSSSRLVARLAIVAEAVELRGGLLGVGLELLEPGDRGDQIGPGVGERVVEALQGVLDAGEHVGQVDAPLVAVVEDLAQRVVDVRCARQGRIVTAAMGRCPPAR